VHRYMISFHDHAMTFPAEDLQAVADASHAVVDEARAAGVWVFGGGLLPHAGAVLVEVDGTVRAAPHDDGTHYLGGFCVLDVDTPADGERWAARFAVACRCPQEVREIMYDPKS
jgi:hypothetical protein